MMSIARRIAVYVFLLSGVVWLIVGAGCSKTGGEHTSTEPEVGKIKVMSLDELPAHTYPLSGTVTDLLNDPVAFAALKDQYRQDVESDLATYEIDDIATLQDKFRSLVTIALLDERYDDALDHLEEVRVLEDKESARLMGGMVTRAMIATKQQVGDGDADRFKAVFEGELHDSLFDLPYDVVQDQVKSNKGRAEYLSENLMMGMVQSRLEPAAAAQGELSADIARSVLGIRYAIDNVLPLNPTVAKVYQQYLDANAVEKENIWPARAVTLEAGQSYAPVVVAIWDSGVDTEIFGEQVFVNSAEKLDGTDTDGNGFVDDVHGIAFDVDGVPSSELLHPLGDQEGKLDAVREYMKGFIDITSAVDSPEAAAVRQTLGTLEPAEVGDFLTSLSFGGLYMHGTHVAGIALEGNPYARALVARITFDYHPQPKAMTMETAKRMADGYLRTADYFRAHNVRLANMSWGWTFKEIEASLEANGVGESAEERVKMARQMIDVLSQGLYDAMAATPEILYVTAAGNDDNDVEFDVVIPSSFEMDNLLVVGAVDQAGDPTGFTSGGRNVLIFANGFEVESYVPGGERMKMSGTSMSSPNVCNLAAKLLAVNPELTPEQVIELIEEGADMHPEDSRLLRINPRKSMELLQK